MLSSGCRLFYTNKKHLKDDIAKQKPQFLIAVPRLYNVIYQGMCPRNRGDGGGAVCRRGLQWKGTRGTPERTSCWCGGGGVYVDVCTFGFSDRHWEPHTLLLAAFFVSPLRPTLLGTRPSTAWWVGAQCLRV